MVYSYPAGGETGAAHAAPRRLWRLRAVATPADAISAVAAPPLDPPPPSSARSPPANPVAHKAAPDLSAAAYESAARGYDYLRAGDRRSAASAFAVALSLAPDHPNARAWARERHTLAKWWRVEAYVFQRPYDNRLIRVPGLPAASPVLGGGVVAGMIALSPNPLGRRRVEVLARYSVPQNGVLQLDGGRAQAALGVAVRPFPRVPVTLVAERLLKLGSLARSDWQIRAYGGGTKRVAGIDLSAFGEAGVIGARPDYFAGGQLLVEKAFRLPGNLEFSAGLGTWGAMQQTNRTVDRLDIGPTARLSHPRVPMALRVDYRRRVAGNARPDGGLTVTLSAAY